ncbi:MAG TPA: hypothetical protein VNQ76_12615 [Planctomicrobium sp.]|nr:hypothetical protein [Planctomicrobium sp.]
MVRVSLLLIMLGVWWSLVFSSDVHAQSVEENPAKTLLEIDLVLPAGPTNPLLAQRWRQEFQQINESVRIRQGTAEDHPGITEKTRGPFRIVNVVGLIDLDGKLKLKDRTFQTGQSRELGVWLNEIKTYGAQGSPSGKPQWGLTDEQFAELRQQLSAPTTETVLGLTMGAAIGTLPIPGDLPLTRHSSIETKWEAATKAIVTDETQGLSTGTTLAYLLSQQGLGFRPVRQPNGTIQLFVESLPDIPDPWPVGWPETKDRFRGDLVPGLFKFIETGVRESSLSSTLDAIEERSGVRLILDLRTCHEKRLDPDEIQVSYPRKRTTWALIVQSISVKSFMTMHYREDEAGTGFIWISPFARYVPPKDKKPVELMK